MSLSPTPSSPLRAPTADGGLLSRPGPEKIPTSLRANALILQTGAEQSLQGKSLSQLREWTRESALQSANDYTRDVLGITVESPSPRGVWFVTGHQPALFHPGVWAKNFAVAALARQHKGFGLNLIVDNDVLTSTSVAVPRGPRSSPRVESFQLLDPQPPRPWEEAIIDNARPFETFGPRVAEAIEADWGYRPLVADAWTDAVTARENSPRLSDCLTTLRARQEQRWGLCNLELPLSRLEEIDPFRWFTAHLLSQLARFQPVYNRALADYRRTNRIRSYAHPVPELRQRDGGWLEAPFWIWQVGETVRHPLYVRPQARRVELACDRKQIGKLRLSRESDATEAVEDLAFLAGEGWRIRSRALTTTLFARLCLADLFVHGIGGAKYDELTDVLIERFYGLRPPVFLTVTATQHLPLQPFEVTHDDALQLHRQLRDLDFNPHRVPGVTASPGFIAERDRLVAQMADLRGGPWPGVARRQRRGVRHEAYAKLKQLQSAQQTGLDAVRRSLGEQLATIESQLAANRILKSREFAWCLHPEPLLHSLVERVAATLAVR